MSILLPFSVGVLLEFTLSAFDPDMDTLSYSALNLPPGAVFNSASRTFSWTPSAGQTGTYIIRFTVDDSIFSDFEEITIAVGDNQPPTAFDDNYSVDEDGSIIVAIPGVLANDDDPENGPLRAVLISGTANGVLNFNSNGSFDYTPDSTFFGSDSFTYIATDGQLDSNVATVSITVDRHYTHRSPPGDRWEDLLIRLYPSLYFCHVDAKKMKRGLESVLT